MLGAFGNFWTLRLQNQLRFIAQLDSRHVWIADRQKNGSALLESSGRPYAEAQEDYAVISRFEDSTGQQQVLLLAGTGDGGRAAGDFVTNPKHLEALAARAPHGWGSRNLQVIISVRLVSGAIGSPRILAVHYW